jgi:Carboxypeptidase regulatory-like domain/TonB dependent receptor
MRHTLRGWALSAVLLAAPASAQLIVSTIRGSVVDAAGAVVSGAELKVVNLGTNIQRTVTTNDAGEFEVSDLASGSYRLTATHAGFKTFIADNIILENTQIRRIDVTLELGAVTSEVTVRADAALITTDSAKIQGTFTSKRFDDAPWVGDGRNPQTIMTTLPLVQATTGVYGIQLAGQPDRQVQTAIDGVPGDSSSLQASNVHVMQEVDIVTGSNSAEFSRPAYISMATKGGTNQFHGRAVYWHQNSALSDRNFFDATKPKNLFHTMDAEVSGPAIRNRTFFFFAWSGQRWPSSTYYLTSVPTAKMRDGDFSELAATAKPVIVKDPLTGAPFPNNVTPSSRLNATSLKLLQQYLPGPNLGSGALANNFGFLFPYPTDLFRWDSYDYRVDHKLTEKNTIWARMLTSKPLYVLAGTYPAFTWTRVRDSLTFVVEDTHIFSPGVVNTARFGLYRPNIIDGGTVNGVAPIKGDQAIKSLGIEGVNPQNLSAMGFPRIDISGYSSLREQPGGVNPINKNWDYADSLTWAWGRHVLKFGGEFRYLTNYSALVPEGAYGYFTFNGNFSNYGFSDFLLGLPYSSLRLNPLTNRTQLDNETGIYAQDSFKVNNRLTLDFGVRWQRFGAANYDDGLVYNWDPATGNVLVPNSALSKISPLYPVQTIKVAAGPAIQSPSLHNFAPRIGVAYRPFGDKFVIRGGYGIFTETLGPYARAQGGGPFQLTETFFNTIQNGQALFSFPNAFPAGAGSVPSQSVSGFDPNTSNGQIHQFSATVERQLRDIGLRLSYLGSRSRNLNYTIEIDKPQPSLTPFAQSRRPYPQFVSTMLARNDGAANFNSMTLEAQRKVGQVVLDAHWSWSSNYNNMLNLENPYSTLFWGRDPNTVRHRVVLNAIWNIPLGKGHRVLGGAPAAVNQIVGGWQLYWIGYFETGQFFSPSFSGSDPSNTNTSGGLPNRICNGNLPPGQRTVTHWFNPACFVVPPAGQFGNSGADVLEGPGLQLNNLTIGKTFPIHERLRFTFMVAAQNALNHPNFSNPSSNISAPGSVGVISSVDGFAPARQIMLRGRIEF